MTDPTDSNPPPPPPPANQPAAAPAPQTVVVKEGAGCWKIGGIVVAVLAVLGIIGGGCALLVGGAAVESIDEAVQESTGVASSTDYAIEITSCEGDEFIAARASGTITNTSDKERAFQVQVKFTNADGSLISTDSTFTDKLASGQSTGWEVLSFSSNEASDGFRCDVDEVSYTIFGS